MNFQLFKKYNFKTILITGVIAFSFLIASLIIIFSLTEVELGPRMITLIQLLINVIFVWLLIIIIHKSKILVSFIYNITSYKKSETDKVFKKQFNINKLAHLLVFIISVALFFIEISVISVYTDSWISAIKSYWWVSMILFIFDLFIFEISFNISKYLYNTDKKLFL